MAWRHGFKMIRQFCSGTSYLHTLTRCFYNYFRPPGYLLTNEWIMQEYFHLYHHKPEPSSPYYANYLQISPQFLEKILICRNFLSSEQIIMKRNLIRFRWKQHRELVRKESYFITIRFN